MKTNLLLLIVLLLGNLTASSKVKNNHTEKSNKNFKTIRLEFIDSKYKQLSMIAWNYKSKNNEYKGKSTDGRNWVFKIPDSVFNKAMGVCFKNFNADDNEAIKMMDLCYIQQRDTFVSPNFMNFSNVENINLKLKYLKRYSNQNYHRDSTGVVKLTNYITDFYYVKKPDIETILSIREYASYCWFETNLNPNKTYGDLLKDYVKLAKQHPNSKTLLCMLLNHCDGASFKCKEDIEWLFNSFSKQNQSSYLGEIIRKKLTIMSASSKFENIKLQNSFTHQIEPIISDSTKFNLVIFSASWCFPCHKLIPLLKEINNDLRQNLNLIYVSIDEQNTVNKWEALLQKENITWRSLSAYDNLEYVKNKYLAHAVPKSLLIYPDGKMENLDIRKTSDKEKLYKLVMNR